VIDDRPLVILGVDPDPRQRGRRLVLAGQSEDDGGDDDGGKGPSSR
jgi:hypothetical protein